MCSLSYKSFVFNIFIHTSIIQSYAWNTKLYSYHPFIHMFGNHGFSGMLHAELAPLITKMIDKHAYDSIDIRDEVHKRLYNDCPGRHERKNINLHPAVLDICCGTGFSTMKNHKCVGIDNSIPMINKAIDMHDKLDDIRKPHFILSDAEYNVTTYTGQLFDIVTCFFAFHEIPYDARNSILQNHLNNVN